MVELPCAHLLLGGLKKYLNRRLIFTFANTETWSYNAKGEVVTASHSNNSFDRSYEFDGIGNRKKSADSITLPVADNYVANTLNQLTTVNGGARIHDADGNLTDDGSKLFVWDAENRLIEIKLKSDSSTVATYAYDYKSRRITKTVGATETNFIYEGWNPIAEFSGTTLSKSYVWGMDLSGSMQGAGGVGGLLSVNDGNDTYYPTFDGNGNVSEYVDATGNVVAHYEYDAFGQVVASGSMKDDFTHQFSTKQLDSESGLHYYGYRYYDSSNGRWLGRDPIGEQGGVNLFGFVGNNGVNLADVLGLKVYMLFYYDKPELDSFKRAAETRKREIEASDGFDPKCDQVIVIGVRTVKMFKYWWKLLAERSASGNLDDLVAEIDLYTHTGSGGRIYLSGTDFMGNIQGQHTMTNDDISELENINFTDDAVIGCHGCNSGLSNGDHKSVAETLSDTQNVDTSGETGYSYPSPHDEQRYGTGHHVNDFDETKNVYYNAYGKGGKGWDSYGMAREDNTFKKEEK